MVGSALNERQGKFKLILVRAYSQDATTIVTKHFFAVNTLVDIRMTELSYFVLCYIETSVT